MSIRSLSASLRCNHALYSHRWIALYLEIDPNVVLLFTFCFIMVHIILVLLVLELLVTCALSLKFSFVLYLDLWARATPWSELFFIVNKNCLDNACVFFLNEIRGINPTKKKN